MVQGEASHHPGRHHAPVARLVIPAHPVHLAMVHVTGGVGVGGSTVGGVAPPLSPQLCSSASPHHHWPGRIASHDHVWKDRGREGELSSYNYEAKIIRHRVSKSEELSLPLTQYCLCNHVSGNTTTPTTLICQQKFTACPVQAHTHSLHAKESNITVCVLVHTAP